MNDEFAGLALPVEVTSRMIINHPLNGMPLRHRESGAEAYLDLLSEDSAKAVAFDRNVANRRLARGMKAVLTAEEIEARQIERLAHLTVGWSLVALDGEPMDVKFSEAAARRLYEAPAMTWLREQAMQHQANRQNFAKAS